MQIESEDPIPVRAEARFRSIGRPPVLVEEEGLSATYLASSLGTAHIQVEFSCDGETSRQELKHFVLFDREKAVFFDPIEGSNYNNKGTIDSPYKDPVSYLGGIKPETRRRHLYVRSGEVESVVSEAIGFSGAEVVLVAGGYGRDPEWTRDLAGAPSTLRLAASHDIIVRLGEGSRLVVDGIRFLDIGITCPSNARADFLRSQLFRGLGTECEGIALNNEVVGSLHLGREMLIAFNSIRTTWERPPHVSPDSLGQLRHNVVSLDGELSREPLPHWEFSGNAVHRDGATQEDIEWLAWLDEQLVASERNHFVETPCAQVEGEEWTFSDREACTAHPPFEVEDDPYIRAGFLFDRLGTPRPQSVRTVGPIEAPDRDGDGVPAHLDGCPFDASQAPPYGSCPHAEWAPRVFVSPEDPIVGEEVELRVEPESIDWSGAQISGPEVELREGDVAGQFFARAFVAGGAAFRFEGETPEGRHLRIGARLEFYPGSGRSVHVKAGAQFPGDGSASDPFPEWPELLDASAEDPIDVLIARGEYRLPTRSLPPHVRVFGGYVRAAGDRWLRLPLFGNTSLTGGTQVVTVEAGDAALDASSRVLDGVTLRGSLHVEGGPLTIVRSRLVGEPVWFGPEMLGPALRVGPTGEVVVVGNQFEFAYLQDVIVIPPSVDETPMIEVAPGGTPSILFNDFWRMRTVTEGGAVAPAIHFEGDGGGDIVGNRLFWEVGEVEEADRAFISWSGLGSLLPARVYGNAMHLGERAAPFANAGVAADWDAIEALATQQPEDAAPNLSVADCATGRDFLEPWFDPAGGSCRGAAGAGGERLEALEAEVAPERRAGLRYDRYGVRRPLRGASIGSLEWTPPEP